MTGSHHETIMMSGSQQRRFVRRHFQESFHTAHPGFQRRLKIAAGKYLSRFPATQHALVVSSADWKSSRAPRSCTNKNFASRTALKWFESYMSGHTHSVRIGAESSEFRPLKYGVPQGSVLGPQLFCIYTTLFIDILKQYPRVSYHKFADDLQNYISYCPNMWRKHARRTETMHWGHQGMDDSVLTKVKWPEDNSLFWWVCTTCGFMVCLLTCL